MLRTYLTDPLYAVTMKNNRRSLIIMSIVQDTAQSDDPDQSLQSDTGLLIRKAGRPRSTTAHKAILNATLELFADEGFDAMSIEAFPPPPVSARPPTNPPGN